MIDAASKAFFHFLAGNDSLRHLASRYGMAGETSFARRFIAGETIEEAIDAARAIEARGLSQTLDYLGESVATVSGAQGATADYGRILARIAGAGIGRNISLKLTQLGLEISPDVALANLRQVVEPASRDGFFVRIDMENSPFTDPTLAIFESLWSEGFTNLGVVLQSALFRTSRDLPRIVSLGARVRLVKGAYKESADLAYQRKPDVDAAYVMQMQYLLAHATFPALATHDAAIIDAAKAFAARERIAKDRFEFQMLYGVRRDLQAALVREGYGVRVYVPFGRQWFAYFMRRLGERPANVAFVLRSLVSEK
jgi:proline dehydrogenase